MTLSELIDIADSAYPDGLVRLHHDFPEGEHGDTLAQFIARELRDTFDPSDRAAEHNQLIDAIHAIQMAIGDLDGVRLALEARLERVDSALASPP